MLDTVTRSGKLTERERFAGAIEASLQFSKGGGRTVLTRQRIPYPFHATRPFYLDQARPDLATLYLQSAAGGLYRGDRVALSITAEPHSAAHVTTQAATIVHRTHRFPIEQSTRLDVGDHAFLALTPDPLVLFPGAEISCATEVTLAASGCAILTDGLAHHDPEGLDPQGLGPEGFSRSFERYSNAVVVRDAASRVLLSDRGTIAGEAMFAPSSPLGPYRAAGTVFVLGHGAERCDAEHFDKRLAATGCVAGFSKLPNNAGIGSRVLAANGGALARGLEAAFAIAFEALIGVPPARRRK
ncbi:MAG TPA: urease accessory protein UreD [Xanthobacteraceae bacterium]|nr:urease accessory protein UreD [Xanthobacteraceae bacterium]